MVGEGTLVPRHTKIQSVGSPTLNAHYLGSVTGHLRTSETKYNIIVRKIMPPFERERIFQQIRYEMRLLSV